MPGEFNCEGLTIAPGVVETILAQAVLQVEGVCSVGAPKVTDSLLTSSKRRNPGQGILITAEAQAIKVIVHVKVYFGYRLPELASAVRRAVSETMVSQIGVKVSAVDVYIDSIAFPETGA